MPAGISQWQRLNLNVTLEVSELLEVLLITSESDLLGLMPRSFANIARETFKVKVLEGVSRMEEDPVLLIWHRRRQDDPAHMFLRQQISTVVQDVVKMQGRKKTTARNR